MWRERELYSYVYIYTHLHRCACIYIYIFMFTHIELPWMELGCMELRCCRVFALRIVSALRVVETQFRVEEFPVDVSLGLLPAAGIAARLGSGSSVTD